MPEAYDDLKADFSATVPHGRYPNANDGRWGAALDEWQRRKGTDADRRSADYGFYREMVNAAIEIHGEDVAEMYRVTIRRHREERDRYRNASLALGRDVAKLIEEQPPPRREPQAKRKARAARAGTIAIRQGRSRVTNEGPVLTHRPLSDSPHPSVTRRLLQ